MTEDRISAFIRSFEQPKNEVLDQIRKEAKDAGVPVIRPETGQLLSFFTELTAPKKVLEVGTGTGYSALLMLHSMPDCGTVTTIENWPPRIEAARKNFERAGASDRIELLQGDAGEILPTLAGSYDLIFMDAAKAQYITWLPEILRLLSPGGILISDNILQEGEILESRYAVPRRDRTIHKRMREYLECLFTDPALTSVLIPTGDGVAVTRKKKR